ncbi:MAG: SufD family Fe-S cluster assembly protein [Malacoplasma sp.]|nr:SufD family Fe-S cluster assembly protein [Malacoplasma sp.]
MKNENQVYFLNNKNYSQKFFLEDNQDKNIFIIDILKEDVNMNIDVYLKSDCNLFVVISSLNDRYQKNYNINVYHQGDNSNSNCQTFGINKNNSKSSFCLKGDIARTSRNNYCEQKIRGILLSDDAEIKGNPSLIIDTNNIKAKHALAIGRLNLSNLFYLQSKGIKKSDAIKLLLLSYFNVILYQIEDKNTQEKIMNRIFYEIGEID